MTKQIVLRMIPIWVSEISFDGLMAVAGRSGQRITTFDEVIRGLLAGPALTEAIPQEALSGYVDALRAGARRRPGQ